MRYIEPLLVVAWGLTLAGWIGVRRYKRSWLVALGLIGFFIVSWPPVDWLLSRPLEMWYQIRPFDSSAHPEALVVLSSYVDPPIYERPYPLMDSQTFERCQFAAWLYRHWQPMPVLASGGRAEDRGEPYSATMREFLEQAGVPAAMIWTEERSHSTHENAVFSAQVLHHHGVTRVALVVDATSMPRAAASFRKAGIEVVPAVSEFRQLQSLDHELLPSWKAVRHNEITFHETVALAWYWLHGWI